MNAEAAETLALQALGWLVSQDDVLSEFLAASGGTLAGIRAGIRDGLRTGDGDPTLLRSVLDFLLQDDARVTAFSDAAGLAYDAPMRAQMAMLGAAGGNWT